MTNDNIERAHIAVAGAGYAGFSAALQLRKSAPNIKVTILDRRTDFLRVTHLHKTVYSSLKDWQIPFAELCKRNNFNFIEHDCNFDEKVLTEFNDSGKLNIRNTQYEFSALIVSTGFQSAIPSPPGVWDIERLCREDFHDFLKSIAAEQKPQEYVIVGAGPTGLQFLFELKAKAAAGSRISLVFLDKRPLSNYPASFSDYVLKKLEQSNIEVYAESKLISEENALFIEGKIKNQISRDAIVLFLTGVKPSPMLFSCDAFGRVLLKDQLLEKVFSAGDASKFSGNGLNAMTAQAAVRKGRLVAENILKMLTGQNLNKYNFKELGFFISLGPFDGLGYMLIKEIMLSGLPAFAVKESIELQFDLFVQGFDTYPPFLL